MVWFLRKCEKCHRYTLQTRTCPYCDGNVRLPHPPKFSPDDRYLKYRMALREERSEN